MLLVDHICLVICLGVDLLTGVYFGNKKTVLWSDDPSGGNLLFESRDFDVSTVEVAKEIQSPVGIRFL